MASTPSTRHRRFATSPELSPRSPLSRRRFLTSAGTLAAGAVVGGELVLLAATGRWQSAGTPAGSPLPSGAASSSSPRPQEAAAASPTATPGARRVFRSRPDIASSLVEITTLAGVPTPGLIFLTPANGDGTNGPTIVDGAGELVWMRPDTNVNATDLRVTQYNGQPVLTWWEGANNAGIGSGEHVMVDGSYREVMRIQGQSGRKADLHELRLTAHGTSLSFGYGSQDPQGGLPASMPKGVHVMDCAVQEVDLATGALRFEWHAVDHVDLSESVIDPPTDPTKLYDFFHGNAIDEHPDGSLIVSARNTSAVYKVDRTTGKILWRLGGKKSDFALGPGVAFALQHDVRWRGDGTVTIFDDGQAPAVSRGIVLAVDETAMTATLVREYRQPDGLFASSQGSMQILSNGNVFVGWGSVPRFSEFTHDGRLILDAQITATMSYRDERFAWVGRPADPPAIAADAGSPHPVVFASWNGATEVASWDVMAGNGSGALRRVASSPRTGFETVIAVPGLDASDTMLAVQARDAAGTVLGTSAKVARPA